MGHVDRAGQGAVFMRGNGHQMRVGDQPRSHHVARILAVFLIVHHESLRQNVQHHAVFEQLHAHGAVHGAVDVALFDFARARQIDLSLVAGAAHRKSADAGDGGLHVNLRHGFGLLRRRRECSSRPPADPQCGSSPSPRRERSRSRENAAVRLPAARSSRGCSCCPRRCPSRVLVLLSCSHSLSAVISSPSAHQNPVVQTQIEHGRVRILRHFRDSD